MDSISPGNYRAVMTVEHEYTLIIAAHLKGLITRNLRHNDMLFGA